MTAATTKKAVLVSRKVAHSRAKSFPVPLANAVRRSAPSASKTSFIAALVGVMSTSWLTSVTPKASSVSTTPTSLGAALQGPPPWLQAEREVAAMSGVATRPIAPKTPKAITKGRRPYRSERLPTQGCKKRPATGEQSQQMVRKRAGTLRLSMSGMNSGSHTLHPSSGMATANCAAARRRHDADEAAASGVASASQIGRARAAGGWTLCIIRLWPPGRPMQTLPCALSISAATSASEEDLAARNDMLHPLGT
mmetsp:Transcript_18376/g.39123  ORF Transcript_18376/g.39123 Transcript_18376/m.39123 type:complete len:252 (+) Transcript_18376:412-1167(+)